MATSEATYPPRTAFPPATAPDAAMVAEAACRLVAARRPMIWAGGGAMDAGAELLALADALDAPVVLTTEAKGAVSDRHPRILPSAAATTLLPHADAVVVVGSRFFTSSGEPRLADGAVMVRIDVDPDEHARVVSPAIGLEADAGLACAALAAAVAACRPPDHRHDGRVTDEVAALAGAIRDEFAARFEELAGYCAAVRAALPDDGILVDEMTQVGYFGRNSFPTYSPRTYLGSGYQGTLGFGYATALGAKVGRPDRVVVSLSGDGGFMYNVAELATAAQHGIGVVVVVFDDGAFGNVKRIQSRTFGREIASTLINPDFAALRAFLRRQGLPGRRSRRPRRVRGCRARRRRPRARTRADRAPARDLGHPQRARNTRLARPFLRRPRPPPRSLLLCVRRMYTQQQRSEGVSVGGPRRAARGVSARTARASRRSRGRRRHRRTPRPLGELVRVGCGRPHDVHRAQDLGGSRPTSAQWLSSVLFAATHAVGLEAPTMSQWSAQRAAARRVRVGPEPPMTIGSLACTGLGSQRASGSWK